MGHGTYSYVDSLYRTTNIHSRSTREQIFSNRQINSEMNPFNMTVRESCDSDEHPESKAIILGLDVTGSMGYIPEKLIKEDFPEIMKGIMDEGITDSQILFCGIGDHNYDNAPIQVGQFESSDVLLEKWLTNIYLEGGGGGNDGESYFLAWYIAKYFTDIACFTKRKQKGLLITIGDEPNIKNISKNHLTRIFGNGQYSDTTTDDLLNDVSETYNVYHINVAETASGKRPKVKEGWEQLLHDNVINAQKRMDIKNIIIDLVKNNFKSQSFVDKIFDDQEEIKQEDNDIRITL